MKILLCIVDGVETQTVEWPACPRLEEHIQLADDGPLYVVDDVTWQPNYVDGAQVRVTLR